MQQQTSTIVPRIYMRSDGRFARDHFRVPSQGAEKLQKGTISVPVCEGNGKSATKVKKRVLFLVHDWIRSFGQAFDPIEKSLDRIRLEVETWRRDAPAPNTQAFSDAEALLSRLKIKRFRPDRVLHSAEGGIGFLFRSGRRYADFECSNAGSVTAVVSDGAGHVEAWPVETSFIEQTAAIDKVRAFIES